MANEKLVAVVEVAAVEVFDPAAVRAFPRHQVAVGGVGVAVVEDPGDGAVAGDVIAGICRVNVMHVTVMLQAAYVYAIRTTNLD